MKFQFSEKKVKLPGNVHAYAEKKVMKLARFFEEDAEALIVFSVEKNRNNVELTVRAQYPILHDYFPRGFPMNLPVPT